MVNKESDYDRVFELIDHPEAYTPDELSALLSDPETKEIYELLCAAASATGAARDCDIEAEWREFSQKRQHKRKRAHFFGSRAASIAVLIGSSILALAAGIAVTVTIIDRKTPTQYAVAETADSGSSATDTLTHLPAVEISDCSPVLFENETLENIMKEISETYGVEVLFSNGEVAELQLFYQLAPSLNVDEIVEQLNTFGSINITRDGQRLIID